MLSFYMPQTAVQCEGVRRPHLGLALQIKEVVCIIVRQDLRKIYTWFVDCYQATFSDYIQGAYIQLQTMQLFEVA